VFIWSPCPCRVTRLSEFSPIGQLFFHGTTYVLILANNWLGFILGDFFTNSSGLPDCRHVPRYLETMKMKRHHFIFSESTWARQIFLCFVLTYLHTYVKLDYLFTNGFSELGFVCVAQGSSQPSSNTNATGSNPANFKCTAKRKIELEHRTTKIFRGKQLKSHISTVLCVNVLCRPIPNSGKAVKLEFPWAKPFPTSTFKISGCVTLELFAFSQNSETFIIRM
jgi:hypothetical protein